MDTKRKYILAGVAATALVLAAAGAVAHRAGPFGDGPGHFRHGGGFDRGGGALGMMGMAGFGVGSPMGRFCRRDGAEMADHMIVRLEHRLKPTHAQGPAFEEFKTAIRTAAGKMQAGCPKTAADDTTPPPSPIERLAQAEAGLEASLDALKTFRPAAEKFYATLSDAQKEKLKERRRPWGRDGGRDWGRDKGPDKNAPKPDDAPTPDKG